MTDTSYQGTAEISCLARIEGTRSVDEDAVIVMYDVVIPTSDLVNGSKEILCALAYAPDYDEDAFVPGLYRISLKVCFPLRRLCVFCLMPLFLQGGQCLRGTCIADSGAQRMQVSLDR